MEDLQNERSVERKCVKDLVWPELTFIRMKVNPKTKKLTNVYIFLNCWVFERLICPRRGEFAGLFSKTLLPGLGRGEWALLEITDALFLPNPRWLPRSGV